LNILKYNNIHYIDLTNLSKIKFGITKVFSTFEVPKVSTEQRCSNKFKLWAFFMPILKILYSTQKVVYHSSNRKIGSKLRTGLLAGDLVATFFVA